MVCGFTGSSNWTVTRALIGTCINPSPGLTAVTCGPAVLTVKPVVKENPYPQHQETRLPTRSSIVPDVFTKTWWVRPVASGAFGAKYIVSPSELWEYVPARF